MSDDSNKESRRDANYEWLADLWEELRNQSIEEGRILPTERGENPYRRKPHQEH